MTIQFDDNIRAIVFQQFCDTGDFMMAVHVKDGKNTATGRIRWYREHTGDPFRDKDDKNWGELSEKHRGRSVKEIINVCRVMIASLIAFSEMAGRRKEKHPLYVLERGENEDYMAFFKRFKELPFVHSKEQKLQ